MNLSDKDQALLRKLYALSVRGVEGERENARQMFLSMCEKFGVHPADFEAEEKPKERSIKYKKKFKGQDMTAQIIASVVGKRRSMFVDTHNSELIVELTDTEFAEVQQKLGFYYAQFLKDLETYYEAWIQKNKLYVKPEADKEKDEAPLTEAEKERIRKVLAMMQGMDAHKFHKQLNG